MNVFRFNHYSLFQPNRRLWRFDDPPTSETNPRPETGGQTLQTEEVYLDDPFKDIENDTNHTEEEGLEEQKQCIGSCQNNLSDAASDNGTGGDDPELTVDPDKYEENNTPDEFDNLIPEEEADDEPAEQPERLDAETKAILLENFSNFAQEAMKAMENGSQNFLAQWVELSGFNLESEAGKEVLNKGLEALINDLGEEEIANIKADPNSFSFEGQAFRVGSLILQSAGMSEEEVKKITENPENAEGVFKDFLKNRRLEYQKNNPDKTPLTEEEVLATLQNPKDTEGLQELAERLGEYFSFFMEFYKKADYAGMIDVFEVGIMEGGDPEQVEKESKERYMEVLKGEEWDVNTLFSIITNPRGREADSVFGGVKRFRKGAEEAGLSALSDQLGVKISTVTQEGEETIIEYDSKYKAELTQRPNEGPSLKVAEYVDGAYKYKPIQAPEITRMDTGESKVETGEALKAPENNAEDGTIAHLTEGGDLNEFLRRHLKVS